MLPSGFFWIPSEATLIVLGNMAPAKSVQEMDRPTGKRGVQGGKRRINLATLIPERLLLGIFDAPRGKAVLNLEVWKIRARQVSCVALEWLRRFCGKIGRRIWPRLRLYSGGKGK